MIGFLGRFLSRFFGSPPWRRRPGGEGGIPEEFWEADFSKPGGSRFDMAPERAYDARIQKEGPGFALAVGLKKSSCLVWVEGSGHPYGDMIARARLRLDPRGGYGAAGLLFRLLDEGTYYLALISSKGYFRLDLVRNNTPLALIGWTECGPGAGARELTVITYGSHITLLIDGLWAAALRDSSIGGGGVLGFALASYEAGPAGAGDGYVAEAFLEYLSVDTRLAEVEAAWRAWDEAPTTGGAAPATGGTGGTGGAGSGTGPGARFILGESRLRLAETFAALGESVPALVQLNKLREGEGAGGGGRALLLAARLAQTLGHYDEAEEYLGACLADAGGGEDAGEEPGLRELRWEASVEKAKLLYAGKRYPELRDYVTGLLGAREGDAVLLALLGQAHWELGNYAEAAAAYDRAFELDRGNGLHAANAANVYELAGLKEKALSRYLAAGRAYLEADNYQDLGVLIPKLLALGPERGEAHALAGKWAFGVEDWEGADREFEQARLLWDPARPGGGEAPADGAPGGPEQDPALSYLRALLLIRKAKRREALPLLEEAARLAPDYGLFRFRLAENRYLLDNDPASPGLRADLEAALALLEPAAAGEGGKEGAQTWGWANNLAAQVSLAGGDPEAAAGFLEKAAAALGETPPVLMNRALYHYLRGSLDQALAVLEAGEKLDPEGALANCGGNLLVRSGQFDKAGAAYRRALALAPDNPEFLVNLASCLVELGSYGEADTLLARAHNIAPSPAVLELIAYVAVKKGEYPRAETACKAALDMDRRHVPSLRSLGWLYASAGRWEEAREILARLDSLTLSGENGESREELRQRILDGTTRLIPCARCGRTWRVPKDPPPVPFLRLLAMPPDEVPAGTCPSCGATYCIGCAKEHLDGEGRFICPACGRALKLINEGLKKIVADWAAGALPGGTQRPPTG